MIEKGTDSQSEDKRQQVKLFKRRQSKENQRGAILPVLCAVTFATAALTTEAVKQTNNYSEGYRQWPFLKFVVIRERQQAYYIIQG